MTPNETLPEWLAALSFDARGLIPAIAQDATTHRVLMVAWMNAEALRETVRTGRAVYFSRSRNRLWRKGEESGHTQEVQEIRLDCDGDVLLLKVRQTGGIACHTGRESCFYRRLDADSASGDAHWVTQDPVLTDPARLYARKPEEAAPAAAAAPGSESLTVPDDTANASRALLERLADTLATRRPERGGDPARSYTARLLAQGPDAFLKKIGEEATELVMAAKDQLPARVVSEMADLWFHCLVVLTHFELRPEHVLSELARREGLSGLDEKAARKSTQPHAPARPDAGAPATRPAGKCGNIRD